MLRKPVLFFLFVCFFLLSGAAPAAACDSCACTLARCGLERAELGRGFFFDATFEQQNWDEAEPRAAHALHHQGRHVHNKSHEEFYHFTLGANAGERITFLADLPYVVRSVIEIDNHATLGQKEESSGLGDLKLTATWRFLMNDAGFLGVIGGVKLPTGETDAKTTPGNLFEPELQPGSGSDDYLFGMAFQRDLGSRFQAHGNAVYTLKTEGIRGFEYGDHFAAYLVVDRPFYDSAPCRARLGLDANLQLEDRQKQSGRTIRDSGGATLLVGPSLHVSAGEKVSLFANFLLPAFQDLGGVHQELDFAWNAGAKIRW